MEPDFKAFAQAWVQGDDRLKQLKPDQAEDLVVKLAQAMDKRRRRVEREPSSGGDLIVTVPEDMLKPSGLTPAAMKQLVDIFDGHLKKD